jgi:hypothetical protein
MTSPIPAVHFCSFGSVPDYARALQILEAEARASGYFATVSIYTQENLPAKSRERRFMEVNRRGYGYWIWKGILLEDMMEKVPEGDIVLYADAGCGISTTPTARANMAAWISDCQTHPTHRLSFQMPHVAEVWTKADVFTALGTTADEYTKTGQHMATIQMYQNTPENRRFIQLYKAAMAAENYHYVSDEPSRTSNPPCFKDHRHDQAILSLLFKLHGAANREDHWRNPDFPVMALRRRRG